MKRKRILIAGYGYVGTRLAELLLAAGHDVSVIKRSNLDLTPGLKHYRVDLCDAASLVAIPKQFDNCIYLVAADNQTREAYYRAYVLGLKNLISHFNSASEPSVRYVFASSTSVYHQSDGSWVDESSPTKPIEFTGQILLEAEELLFGTTVHSTVVRFSGIYGPGRMRLLEQVKSGLPPKSDLSAYSNRFHLEDCARLLSFLISRADAKSDPSSQISAVCPKIVIGTDNEPTRLGEIYDWIAKQLQLSLPSAYMEREQSTSGLRSNKRCSNALIRQLGYAPCFPSFREGFQAAIDAQHRPTR